MDRIPEPEVMNEALQVAAYAKADFSEPNERFIELCETRFPEAVLGRRVVDLGCGPGDLTRRFVQAYRNVHVTAIDAADRMLAWAAEATRAAGLEDRITYRLCRIPDPRLGKEQFDAVISNSLLHHLPEPLCLWQTVAEVGRPAAAVFVMDLVRPSSPAAAMAIVDQYAADEPEILREDFFRSLCAAYRVEEIENQLERAGLRQLRVAMVSDRHWVVSGRL